MGKPVAVVLPLALLPPHAMAGALYHLMLWLPPETGPRHIPSVVKLSLDHWQFTRTTIIPTSCPSLCTSTLLFQLDSVPYSGPPPPPRSVLFVGLGIYENLTAHAYVVKQKKKGGLKGVLVSKTTIQRAMYSRTYLPRSKNLLRTASSLSSHACVVHVIVDTMVHVPLCDVCTCSPRLQSVVAPT